MIVLSCSNISKNYVVDKVLDTITFGINNGEKIGVVGLNGCGKSTLFNILSGEISKDSGELYIQKNLKIGYLKQHTQINSNKSIFDECLEVFTDLIRLEKNIRNLEKEISLEGKNGQTKKLNELMELYSIMIEDFTNRNGYGFKSEIKGILKGLGFKDNEIKKEINKLSGGQKSRLELAKLLLKKPDILLLDEPTNHLDIEAIDWLEDFLKDYKGAALIISHDRYFLDNIVTKIFHLENCILKIYKGNYTQFMKKRKKEIEILQKKYLSQQKEINRQEEIIKRFMSYGGQRYIKQAQSRQKMLDKIKKVQKPTSNSKKAKIKFEPTIQSGREVLRIENLKKCFDDFLLFKNLNFTIYRGEKVGLIGPNGIGKTTLFKIILGKMIANEGDIILGHHVNIGYFDQEQSNLNLQKTVLEEIWDTNPNLYHYDIRTMLSQFLFIGDEIFKQIKDLSGGERGRLSLLKLMMSKANFLLMDEPTNHLDIDSKEVLENALQNYGGTLLVISHDRYFLNKTTNKTLELSKEGITEYLGNYKYYIEKKNQVIIEEDEDTKKTKTQIKLEKKKEKQKKQKQKQKKLKIQKIENIISEKEIELKNIDNIMCKPEMYNDIDKLNDLNKERMEIKEQIDNLYEKWIRLTEDK